MSRASDGEAAVGRIEFYFDAICPWAYQTSVWIRDVREQTGLEIDWRFFSLEEINREEGKKHPWEREWTYGWSLMRVGAYLKRKDPELLDRWYEAVARGLHIDGRTTFLREEAEEIAAEIGLGRAVVGEAIDDPSTHDDVRADHDHLVEHYAGFGVPTLVSSSNQAIYGPVIVPAPRGEDALKLWRVVEAWLEFPHLYEMRTPKRASDWAHIGGHFEAYTNARRWKTVQKPVA